jgi:hypothetical protein
MCVINTSKHKTTTVNERTKLLRVADFDDKVPDKTICTVTLVGKKNLCNLQCGKRKN